tara:strand:+ start:549 stop:995 length:447 start_codon:yes stop_codon:yes gene_type:complete
MAMRLFSVFVPVPPRETGTVPELILPALRDDNPEPSPVCVPEKVPPVIVPDNVGLALITMFPDPVFEDNLSLLSVPELILPALRDDNPEPLPVCVPEKVPPVIVPDNVGLALITMFPDPVFDDNLSLLSVPELILDALRDDKPEPSPE